MRWITLSLALLLCGVSAQAQSPERVAARDAAMAAHEAYAQRAADDARFMVRPGLVADRKQRVVRLFGATTAVNNHEPAEFILINKDSAKAYEALAVAFVSGADVVEAMSFIGMEPGRPVDYDALRAWPRGERAIMTFHWTDPRNNTRQMRVERLVHDEQAGSHLPETGLVYTGSYRVPGDANSPRRLAADVRDVGSIVSTYNEPTTIFDLPHQAGQGAVYERFQPAEAFEREPWQTLEVTIEPARPDGPPRVVDLTLNVTAAPDAGPDDLAAVRVNLVREQGDALVTRADIAKALAALANLAEGARDPFVTLDVGADMPLGLVRKVCRMLDAAEGPRGLRMDPPPDGQLYYRAYLPPEKLRDREQRLFHSWELRLVEDDSLTLIETYDERDDEGVYHNAERVTHPADAQALAAHLAATDGPRPRELFVHAPADMPHGRLMTILQPVLPTHDMIHVFLE